MSDPPAWGVVNWCEVERGIFVVPRGNGWRVWDARRLGFGRCVVGVRVEPWWRGLFGRTASFGDNASERHIDVVTVGDVLRGDLGGWDGLLVAASPAMFGIIEVAAGAFANEALAALAP